MRLVLGAWGIGSFLASFSNTWKARFGKNASFTGTLPPMSAVFGGMVEPLPFVLAKRIFMDAEQYEFLISNAPRHTYNLHNGLADFLKEFEKAGILSPFDFRSLLRNKATSLNRKAEAMLDSDQLAGAAVESRRLWVLFLRSPGGSIISNRDDELAVAARDKSFEENLALSDHPEIATLIGAHGEAGELTRTHVNMAALVSGHDVFDVIAMLGLGVELDATVCDWQMYEPLYSLATRLGFFSYALQGGASSRDTNVRCYIPLPSAIDIDEIWKLREDPFVTTLRDQQLARFISKFGLFDDPSAWIELRRSLRHGSGGGIVNPYNAYSWREGRQIFTEALGGVPSKVGNYNTPRNIIANLMKSNPISQRILFLAADPSDACRLRLGEEHREISAMLRSSKNREHIALHEAFAVRPVDLTQTILDVVPTIIHFSGHGSASGHICLEGGDGRVQPVDADALAEVFRHFSDTLKVVVLNACFSATQAHAIAKHVPFVVGMQQAISDKAAIAYSVGFYQALGAGREVVEAHSLGCSQVRLRGIIDHDVPILIRS